MNVFKMAPTNVIAPIIVPNWLKHSDLYLKINSKPTMSIVFSLDNKVIRLANRQVKMYYREPSYTPIFF